MSRIGAYAKVPPLAFNGWRLRVPGGPAGGQYHGYLGEPGPEPVFRSSAEPWPRMNANGNANVVNTPGMASRAHLGRMNLVVWEQGGGPPNLMSRRIPNPDGSGSYLRLPPGLRLPPVSAMQATVPAAPNASGATSVVAQPVVNEIPAPAPVTAVPATIPPPPNWNGVSVDSSGNPSDPSGLFFWNGTTWTSNYLSSTQSIAPLPQPSPVVAASPADFLPSQGQSPNWSISIDPASGQYQITQGTQSSISTWLQAQSIVSGYPNWEVALAGLAVVALLMRRKG